EYRFTEVAEALYHPKNGELIMSMRGMTSEYHAGKQLYGCLWSYTGYGTPTMWYYTLDKDQAVDLGVEYNGNYTDSWVDLQAPLKEGASWTFTSMGETITATITKFGATAKVRGTTYDDVLMVDYTGSNGSHVVEWFAK